MNYSLSFPGLGPHPLSSLCLLGIPQSAPPSPISPQLHSPVFPSAHSRCLRLCSPTQRSLSPSLFKSVALSCSCPLTRASIQRTFIEHWPRSNVPRALCLALTLLSSLPSCLGREVPGPMSGDEGAGHPQEPPRVLFTSLGSHGQGWGLHSLALSAAPLFLFRGLGLDNWP